MLSRRLLVLRTAQRDSILTFTPQSLTIIEVVSVILVFITRQILHLLGIGNSFEKTVSSNGSTVYSVPDLRLSMPLELTKGDLDEYADAVNISKTRAEEILTDPAHLCLLLSALTEPAFLVLLAHHRSPIRPLGSVNVRNRFELLSPMKYTADKVRDGVSLLIHARLLRETRKVKRGLEIDVEVELVHKNDGEVAFRQTFTMLQFMKIKEPMLDAIPPVKQVGNTLNGQAITATFGTRADLTMRWASICKDYNPIHVSDIAAKLFGFRGRLVHGNHAFALALSALNAGEAQLTRPLEERAMTYEMAVQFMRPVVVPASLVVVKRMLFAGGHEYELSKDSKVYILGSSKVKVCD